MSDVENVDTSQVDVRIDQTPTGKHGIMREDLVHPEITNPGSRVRDVVAVLACYFIGAVLLFGISNIGERGTQPGEVGARMWPMGLGWGIVIFGSIILAIAVVKIKTPIEYPDKITRNGLVKFLLAMGVLFSYAYSFRVIPFWASTLVAILLLLLIFEMRSVKSLVFFSALMTVTLQVLFINLLRVPL